MSEYRQAVYSLSVSSEAAGFIEQVSAMLALEARITRAELAEDVLGSPYPEDLPRRVYGVDYECPCCGAVEGEA